jgi:hypothetical protein
LEHDGLREFARFAFSRLISLNSGKYFMKGII